ncbi:hypothetical protein CPT34_12870 [Rhizobium sophoriradicis]|uniref:Uncharacterized protein n=1 Tax=Rhizobium sophoriradicis TaxID=1535245 RepID=A0A2A5KU22_9HYPH|nr:hypothetical protein CPT34_12870 [Rhizobium sophoriradicis]
MRQYIDQNVNEIGDPQYLPRPRVLFAKPKIAAEVENLIALCSASGQGRTAVRSLLPAGRRETNMAEFRAGMQKTAIPACRIIP